MSNAEEIFDSFSYKDYKNWDDGLRYELIHGEAFMMSAPMSATTISSLKFIPS